jgi:acetyl esterase/lipase
MRRNVRLCIGLLMPAALAVAACGADEAKVTTAVDLIYCRVGEVDLRLDMALPAEGHGPFPAVVVIYGGAWRSGSKESNREILQQLARQGFVAISPQYRFCPQETFPAQVLDVKAAVRWLRTHAGDYRVDPDHFGAMGFSAGGHLALMLGLTDAVEADAPSSKVQAVVNFFGPTDLTAADIPEVSRPLVRDFLGSDPSERPELAQRASPVTFVTPDDPPVLTFQGTKDPLVPHTQAVTLADALTAAGVPGRVELLIGAGHGFQGPDQDRTMLETLVFFNQHLKPTKP